MTVSSLQHSQQRRLGTYQPRQFSKQLRQQADVMRDQMLSAANVIDGLCEKVEAADNAARMAGASTPRPASAPAGGAATGEGQR